MEYARHLLDEIGLGAERLEMFEIAASDAPKWVAAVNEMCERVKALGPNPLRLRQATEGSAEELMVSSQ